MTSASRPSTADHGIFERSEWEQPIESDHRTSLLPRSPLGPLLTENIRKALKPVFETRIPRTAYRLNGGDTDIAIAFDNGRIVATNSSCPVSEIELELKRGEPAELFKLARTIGDIVPAQLDVKSKSERGFDLVERRRSPPRRPMSRSWKRAPVPAAPSP